MEQLTFEGPDAMRPVLTALLNEVMKIEREQFLVITQHLVWKFV